MAQYYYDPFSEVVQQLGEVREGISCVAKVLIKVSPERSGGVRLDLDIGGAGSTFSNF